MSVLIEDLLDTWRQAERLLEDVTPVHPDHETLLETVAHLRSVYAELTSASQATAMKIAAGERALERARRVLDAARTRLDRPTT
jgi:hypothetical protein